MSESDLKQMIELLSDFSETAVLSEVDDAIALVMNEALYLIDEKRRELAELDEAGVDEFYDEEE